MLEQGFQFAGINRKLQLMVLCLMQRIPVHSNFLFAHLQTVLEQGGQFAGINRKVQLKALQWNGPSDGTGPDGEKPHVIEALLILKHGGVLTHAGRAQVCAAASAPLLATRGP